MVVPPTIGRRERPIISLEIGALAPDFTAQTPAGPLRFHEWLGQGWGVLFSHPGDFTPVCTTELGAAARLQGEFERRGVKIAALSVDSVEDHRAWSKDITEAQGAVVDFPMIADPDKTVAQLYGMIHAGESDAATVRTVFVIGPDKKIKMTMSYPARHRMALRGDRARHRLASTDRGAPAQHTGRLVAG